MAEIAYVNGVFGPIAEARVSVEDRGFQFGDGVYEVVVAYGGRLFLLAAHMQRLRRSAAAIHLPYDFDARPIEPIVEEALRRSEIAEAMVYIQLTRGAAPRSHAIPDMLDPTLVLTVRERPVVPDELRERGAHVITVRDNRWEQCSIKAITLLPNVLACREARQRGCDDAVFVSHEGEVRECTSANIFMAADGKLCSPPRTESVLHGITRGFLFECAHAIQTAVEERTIDLPTLLAADEVFLSSSAHEVLGVTRIDDVPIARGSVGPLTRRLHQEFLRRSRAAVPTGTAT